MSKYLMILKQGLDPKNPSPPKQLLPNKFTIQSPKEDLIE